MRLRIAPKAIENLDEMFDYWAQRAGLAVAERVVDGITARFGLLTEFPEAGRKREEIATGMRCFPAGRFLIYYRKSRRMLEIVHIFDGVREQGEAFKRGR